jgi:hypothetical protein
MFAFICDVNFLLEVFTDPLKSMQYGLVIDNYLAIQEMACSFHHRLHISVQLCAFF